MVIRRRCATEGCERPAKRDRTQCSWCCVGGYEAWLAKKQRERVRAAARAGREYRTRADISAAVKARKTEELAAKQRRRLLLVLGRGLALLAARRVREATGLSVAGLAWRATRGTARGFVLRARNRVHRARRRGIAVRDDRTLTPAVLARMFERGTSCGYCRAPLAPADRTLDHMLPLFRGGVHGVSNVIVCCARCNSFKGQMSAEEYTAAAKLPRRPIAVGGRHP